ncbi:MAG: hypothetical protein IJ284_05205 [Clostridia bacterium]|nr:hypothetical protein [Clostridia bacterium]
MQARRGKCGFPDGRVLSLASKQRRYEQFKARRVRRTVKRDSCEQDKENAAFPTGAYKWYVTEGKRKFDEVLRSKYLV